MKIILFFFSTAIIQYNTCLSQQIVNIVMVGDKGITQKINEAKYLIVVKKFGDTAYERLDYNFTGPLIKLATYKDLLLKILNGQSASFDSSGYLSEDGEYQNNKKEGNWYVYNDTAHATFKYTYHADSLLSVVDLDSLYNEKRKIKEDTTGQVMAAYKGGDKKFSNFVQKSFKIPERTLNVSKGGSGRARFTIDTLGNIIDTRIIKSVEFSFDEEFLRVIPLAKGWMPASDKGKKLKAYREVPISVKIE